MSCHRCARRLLARADTFGVGEELIGDLLEEIADGRSRVWVWQQLVGLYGLAFTRSLRSHARFTPFAFALASSVLLLAGTSIGSVGFVLEVWLGLYTAAGTLSLFAHMVARAVGTRVTVLPAAIEAPIAVA